MLGSFCVPIAARLVIAGGLWCGIKLDVVNNVSREVDIRSDYVIGKAELRKGGDYVIGNAASKRGVE